MSIKPIDFQVQIPKLTEVAKTSSQEAQKNPVFQQQQAALTQQLAEGTMKKVYSQDKANNAAIREKQKENDNRRNKDRERENEKEDEKEKGKSSGGKDLNVPPKTSTIDIKI